MKFGVANNYNRTNSLTAIAASMTLVSFGLLPAIFNTNAAFAMGDNPSTCNNLYDSTIVFMKITENHKNYYPMLHPVEFNSKIKQGYNVTMKIHIKGNSYKAGSVWFTNDVYGFGHGQCVPVQHGHGDIKLQINNIWMGQAGPGLKQYVYWGTWIHNTPTEQVKYNVTWIN